jgi:hypothetical protein
MTNRIGGGCGLAQTSVDEIAAELSVREGVEILKDAAD